MKNKNAKQNNKKKWRLIFWAEQLKLLLHGVERPGHVKSTCPLVKFYKRRMLQDK